MTTARSRVLVIDSSTGQAVPISHTVRAIYAATESASHLDGSRELGNFELIVANYDGLDDSDRQRLFDAADQDDGPRLLLVTAAAGQLFVELEQHRLTNVLAHNHEVEQTELVVTVRKILRRDIFGLDKYFPWGVEPSSTTIRSSEESAATVELATKLATTMGVHPRLVENIATVMDELITNAFYNAPVDASGAPRFAHLPRTTPVELGPDEEIIVTVCSNGDKFGLSVTDPFGAMTKEQSLDYLAKCLRRKDEKPSRNKGGAGLGLYMTFEAVNHLVLNISPGVKTEVLGLIDVRGNYRDFVNRGKSFNIFLESPDGD